MSVSGTLPAWAQRLIELRLARHWTPADLARELKKLRDDLPSTRDLSHMIRSDWEKGKHKPSQRYRLLLSRVFDTDAAELFAPSRPATSSRSEDLADVASLLDLMGSPGANGRPADADDVERIRETSRHLVSLDSTYGGNDVLPLALRSFRAAYGKLATGSFEAKVERDLLAAVGEAGEIAAWVAYDADRKIASRQLIHEAMLLSRMAGDRDMELFELTHLAMLSISMQRPAEALRVAEILSSGHLPPRVRALSDIRRGRALAQLGNRRESLDTLDRARVALADGTTTRDPHWTWWVTDDQLIWHQGMAHAETGDWKSAVRLLRDSAERATYGRGLYTYLAFLLDAQVHVQDWRDAEPVLAEVMNRSAEIGSARTDNLLLRVIERIERARMAPTSTLSDSAAELRRLLTSGDGNVLS